MKFYVDTFKNEDLNRAVQKVLFDNGISWRFGSSKLDKLDYAQSLYVDTEDKSLQYGSGVAEKPVSHGHKFMSYEEFFSLGWVEKTVEIDGKEYSESTVKAALRDYVG